MGVVDKYSDAKLMKDDCKGNIEKGRISYKFHNTSMDYLQKCIDRFVFRTEKKEMIPFSEMLVESEKLYGSISYSQINKIIDKIRQTKENIALIWIADNMDC